MIKRQKAESITKKWHKTRRRNWYFNKNNDMSDIKDNTDLN